MRNHLLLAVGLCTALSCSRSVGPPLVQPQFYAITGEASDTSSAAVSARMEATIAPYTAQLSDQMNQVLAEVSVPLTKGQPESSLGNWTGDILLSAARDLFKDYPVAFAVQNYGGLRASEIGTGPLTVAELYELMPFDNQLVLMELDGAALQQFIVFMLHDGGWPVSDGLSVRQRGEEQTILVQGQPIDPGTTYYVAMPEYVANGGDDAAMLVGRPQIGSGRMIRDLLIDYAGRSTAPIAVQPDGSRITFE